MQVTETPGYLNEAIRIKDKIHKATTDFAISKKALSDYLNFRYGKNTGQFTQKMSKKDQLSLFNVYFGRRPISIDTKNGTVSVHIEINGYWTGQRVTKRF